MAIKQKALHAFSSAALASIACLVYATVYNNAFEVNYSAVLNTGSITGVCVFSCSLMALAYYFAIKWKAEKLLGWINTTIALLSFVSIITVLGFQLPVSVQSPEMFPGLAIPMHFFPAMAFFALAPFFRNK